MNSLSRRAIAAALATTLTATLIVGCTPATETRPSPAASPSTTLAASDFTAPGAAERVLHALLAAAGSEEVISIEIAKNTAAISVLVDGKCETWAHRDGQIRRVPSDIQYVNQAFINVSLFDISDVGALFRTAAAISGSASEQQLRIIDYSVGEIAMTVTTVPESRTVFFNRDGTPLATLDFTTRVGIEAGLKAAIGTKIVVSGIGISSTEGAWIDYPGPDDTTIRRTRAAKVPPAVAARKGAARPEFSVDRVSTAIIWQIYQELLAKEKPGQKARPWSVTVQSAADGGPPTMHFQVGSQSTTTGLDGKPVKSG